MSTSVHSMTVRPLNDYLPVLARLLMCSLFIWDGVLQLRNPAAAVDYFTSLNVPVPHIAVWVSIAARFSFNICAVTTTVGSSSAVAPIAAESEFALLTVSTVALVLLSASAACSAGTASMQYAATASVIRVFEYDIDRIL